FAHHGIRGAGRRADVLRAGASRGDRGALDSEDRRDGLRVRAGAAVPVEDSRDAARIGALGIERARSSRLLRSGGRLSRSGGEDGSWNRATERAGNKRASSKI